jgi:hypothetical protein
LVVALEVECWTVFVLVCSWLVVPLLPPLLLIALVLIRGLLPVVLVLLHSCAMRHFCRQSHVADVVGMLVGLKVSSGVGALVGIVVNALIVLLITLLMAGNGTLFPENGTLFPNL